MPTNATLQAAPADHELGQKPPRGSAPALTLAASLLGFALITLDASVVNVALPAIGSDLGGGMSGLQWVVDAYTLAFAALMLSTGAFADRIGSAKAYALGTVLFTLASAACGLAPGLGVLIGARVVQGVAAAVVLPASLSLVRQAYPDPARRARAVALWAAGGSVAVALGPVAGGALTTLWDWRGIFFINLPLGLAALALTARAPRAARRPAPLDLPGQLAAALALAALAFAVIEQGTVRIVAGAVAVAAGTAFWLIERRVAHPVVPFGLFRSRTVAVSMGAGATASVAFYGVIFAFSLYFQRVRGESALAAGLMFLPMTVLIPVMNVLSGKLSNRFGPRLPMLIGQLTALAGLLLLLLADEHTPTLLAAFLLVPLALGCGISIPALTAAMMEALPQERAGLAAGVLNAGRQVAGALSIAVFGSLVAGGGGFIPGLRTSLLVAAVLFAVSALATLRMRAIQR
ncbi:MFS transporter [Streptomyces sp. NPDC048416]|uniref:MFS transporter n=1 Tax=Streptomyces sp. NPDC048416 TaxID=3365546 RepID=UPI003723DEF8